MDRKLERTATHEAAHFIIYLHYDELESDFHNLTIVPDEDSAGHFIPATDFHFISNPETRTKMLAAGYASEFIFDKEKDSFKFLDTKLGNECVYPGTDADTLTTICMHYVSPGGTITDFIHPYFVEVIELLKSKWGVVEFVANMLLEKKTIADEDLKELAKVVLDKLKD